MSSKSNQKSQIYKVCHQIYANKQAAHWDGLWCVCGSGVQGVGRGVKGLEEGDDDTGYKIK